MDLFYRVLNDGQCLQPEKVELHQPGLFDPLHVELGRGHVGPRILIKRHQPIQGAIPDDHAGRMGRGVAQQPLDLHAVLQQAVHHLLIAGLLAQAILLREGLFDAHGFHAIDGNHLGQAVDLSVGHLQDAPNVAHCRLGQKRAEGDDLPNLVAAIFLLNVADHFLTAIHAKIDIEVRHGYPLGVEKAFKQQRIAQRVQIGDRQRIGHQRPRTRTTPRPHGNTVVLGPLDEIRNDQKIAGKSHPLDDLEFEIQPRLIVLKRGGGLDHRQPVLQSSLGLTAQFLDLVIGEFRQNRIAAIGHESAAARDLHRVLQRLGQIGE